MGDRRLISIRRRVPEQKLKAYEEGWSRLRELATAAGARAWRFHASNERMSYIEFVEFGGTDDPRTRDDVAEALEALEAIAAGSAEEWSDAS